MSMKSTEVLGLFKGLGITLKDGSFSAIQKDAVDSIEIRKHEIPDDDVINKKYHGGDMRVVHHYSKINYDHLKSRFPDIADRFQPGTYGENIYTDDLTEEDLCIGDIFTLGNAKIQLTVPRRPCATINSSYDDSRVLKEVLSSRHAGWFYCVLEEGIVSVGDQMILQERPYPNLKILNLFDQGYGPNKFSDLEFLKACLDTGLMDKGWKPKLEKAVLV